MDEDEEPANNAADANDTSAKGDTRKRKSATGAAIDASTGGKDSRNTSLRTKKARLSVVGRPQGQNSMIVPVLGANDKTPIPQVSMEVMSSNFEEWMKMATDNVGTLIISTRSKRAYTGFFIFRKSIPITPGDLR